MYIDPVPHAFFFQVGKEKRCLKLLKHKLGTHKRAKIKRENMSTVIRNQKMKA